MNDDDEKLDGVQEESESQPEIEEDDTQKKIDDLKRQLKTQAADFYNFRQRTIKERTETRKRAQEETITAILPVLDNLDRALTAGTEDSASIFKGVEMVQRQFMGVLEGLGVSVIKSEGEKFDPSIHDAAGTEKTDDPELDGVIIREMLKGYRTKDKVLRPAKVIVGKI